MLVSAVWAATLYLSGEHLDGDVRRGLSYLPSVIGLAVVAFDLWLWKLPGVSRITRRPHLYGTWRATLTPSAESHIPPGGDHGPIRAALVIEQTFWTTAVRLHTDQSNSASSTSSLAAVPDSKQTKTLYFTYANAARQEHSTRSVAHHGTTALRVAGVTPNSLHGTYWTDRLTTGDIDLVLVDRNTDRTEMDALDAVRDGDDM
ncbi:hypothetical protein A5692_18775 [Mycobacterium sp. E342]|nr:hypothetical protein A5692_18775 [Mycobacterium sp. E342]